VARPKYPSDLRRRRPAHIVVYTSIRNHPRFGGAFEDPEIRGMWLALWVVARQAPPGPEVCLGLGDLVFITGRAQRAPAVGALRALCGRFEWPLREERGRWYVEIRNFQQKQGFNSATPAETTPESAPPPSFRDSGLQNSKLGGERNSAALAESGAKAPAPPAARSRGGGGGTEPPDGMEAEEVFSGLSVWALDQGAEFAAYATEAEIAADQPKLRRVLAECFDWHRARGKRRRDWDAAARNWLRKEQRIAKGRATARSGDEALAHRVRMRAIEGAAR
jgi:hypothetical protein